MVHLCLSEQDLLPVWVQVLITLSFFMPFWVYLYQWNRTAHLNEWCLLCATFNIQKGFHLSSLTGLAPGNNTVRVLGSQTRPSCTWLRDCACWSSTRRDTRTSTPAPTLPTPAWPWSSSSPCWAWWVPCTHTSGLSHANANAHLWRLSVCGVLWQVFGKGNLVFWIVFSVIHILATLLLSTQLYYMGRWRLGEASSCRRDVCKMAAICSWKPRKYETNEISLNQC